MSWRLKKETPTKATEPTSSPSTVVKDVEDLSFEEAVATLRAMFPEWDPEMLSLILESNNRHVSYVSKVKYILDTNTKLKKLSG